MIHQFTTPCASGARGNSALAPRRRRKKRCAPRLIFICDAFADLLGTILSRSRERHAGLVYLLFDAAANCHKLGCTRRPAARFVRLQTLTPHPLQVTHCIETADITAVERYFHLRFASRRLRGEWFALTVEDVASFTRHETLYTVREGVK